MSHQGLVALSPLTWIKLSAKQPACREVTYFQSCVPLGQDVTRTAAPVKNVLQLQIRVPSLAAGGRKHQGAHTYRLQWLQGMERILFGFNFSVGSTCVWYITKINFGSRFFFFTVKRLCLSFPIHAIWLVDQEQSRGEIYHQILSVCMLCTRNFLTHASASCGASKTVKKMTPLLSFQNKPLWFVMPDIFDKVRVSCGSESGFFHFFIQLLIFSVLVFIFSCSENMCLKVYWKSTHAKLQQS